MVQFDIPAATVVEASNKVGSYAKRSAEVISSFQRVRSMARGQVRLASGSGGLLPHQERQVVGKEVMVIYSRNYSSRSVQRG